MTGGRCGVDSPPCRAIGWRQTAPETVARGEPMSPKRPPRAYLIFTGSGPILVLSTYPKLTDERLLEKLRYKGIDRFIAYEVDLEAVQERYEHSYENVLKDLEREQDMR